MNPLDSAYAASYFNGIIASSFANPNISASAISQQASRMNEEVLASPTRPRLQESLLPQSQTVKAKPELAQMQDGRPRSFAHIMPPRPLLSPADEVAIFGSQDFLDNVFMSHQEQMAARLPTTPRQGQTPNIVYDFDIGEDGEVVNAGDSAVGSNADTGLIARVAALYERNEQMLEETFLDNLGLN